MAITKVINHTTVFIAALISYATAFSSTSSSSTTISSSSSSTTTTHLSTPTASAINDTTTPYFIELAGYTNKDEWGLTITQKNPNNAPPEVGYTVIQKFAIGFDTKVYGRTGNPSFKPWTQCNESGFEIQYVSSNSSNSPALLSTNPWDQPDGLFLANGWSLQEANDTANCTSFNEVETAPFAFNVGQAGWYNGSLVLGGWYDANRIASSSWHLIPESVGNSSFLDTGILDISIEIDSKPYQATLSFGASYPIFMFPSSISGACQDKPLVVSFPGVLSGQTALDIPIPFQSRQTDYCFNDEPKVPVQLGNAFFQAAYAYVDKAGQLYLTAANQLNATTVSMKPFDATANLTLPAGVTEYKSIAISKFAPGFASLPYGLGWNVMLLGLLVAGIAN